MPIPGQERLLDVGISRACLPERLERRKREDTVPVKNLFDYLEGSSTLEEFLGDFPSIPREKAIAVLEAARERLFADATAA